MAIFSGLGAAIGGLLGGTFLSGAVGSFLIKAAVGIGLNFLASALAGQPEKPAFSVQGQLQAGGDVSRSFILGQTATAGSLVYANTWGQDGKTPNAYFTQVIAVADLPTRGLAGVWVNGERCTLLTSEAHAEYGIPVQEYRSGSKDFLWIKFYDGTQTEADSFLVGKVGSATRPYQATRVGKGVSYAVCTARINDKLFTGFPAYKFEVLGSKLYDITKDSTAGGVGTHRLDNPATWGGDGDDLPAVQIYSLMLGHYYGSDWFYGLQGVSSARLPSANWRAQIQKCRMAIDKPGGGTEMQYLAGLEVQVGAPIADAVGAFLTSCQGRISDSGGVYTLRVGAPDDAVFAFSDGDILSTDQQTFTPFFGLADTINGVIATYPEPTEGWNAKAAPPLYRPDLEAKDGGRRLLANVELGAVRRASQVQRLMKSALEEARRARRHTIVLGPSAWVLEPGDVILWTSERNGYNAKLMRVDGVVDRANLDVVLDLTEVDPSDYNWNPSTDYTTPTFGFLGPVRPTPQEIVDWYAAPAVIENASGVGRRPAIRMSWDGGVDDVSAVAFEVRQADTLQVAYRGRTDEVEAGSILISQNLLPDTNYQVRGRYVPRTERDVLWSSWLAVKTPNVLFSGDDILDGAINELKIADRAVSDLKIKLLAIKAELIDNQAVIASKIANGALTIAKFATGIEPVSIIPGTTVPTTKTTEVVMVNGVLYRWNGTAYVADVDVENIKGVLKNAQIESLAASKITGQMTNSQIADLAAAKLTGQLVTSQIADAAMTIAKFATGIRPVELVSSLPGTPHIKGRQVQLSTDDKVYRNTGSGWIATVAADDISGQVQAAQIAALEAVKITGQITGTQITDNAISSPKIATGAIIAGKLAAGAVLAASIAAGAVTTDKLDALAVTADKLAANSVIAGKVAAGAISATEIASKAIAVRHLFVADFSNLIPDSNLEDIGNWTAGGAAGWTFMAPPNIFFSNGRAVRFLGTYTSSSSAYIAQLFSDFIPVEPEQVYAAGIRFDPNAGSTGTLSYHVHWYDRDKVEISFNNVTPYYDVSQSAAAVDFSSRPTAPANAEFARVRLRRGAIENFGEATGTVYAGSMYFRRAASGELIVDGSIVADKIATNAVTTAKIAANAVTANEIAANAVTAVKISAGAVETAKIAAGAVVAASIASGAVTTAKLDALAVTADKLAANSVIAGKVAAGAISADEIASKAIVVRHLFVADFSNLIPDSNLQDINSWTTGGAAGWTFMAPPNIYFASGRAMRFIGTYSSSSSAYIAQIFSDYIPVEPDQAYAAGGRIDPNAGATGTMSFHIHWYDRDKNELSVHNVSPLYDVSQSAAAVDFSTRPVVPANAEYARFRVRRGALVALGDATGTVYAGSLYLRRAASAELIVDGAIYAEKIATNAVTTAKILAGAITAVELGAGSVTAVKIATGAVTAAKINVASLAAISASFGNATFTDTASSANGKMKLDFNNGTIEIFS